ncbi:MAG: isochorismatase family protein [Spirochaetaceae bacterium]|nr:isochorismatase family protein [Spirochaetaceae bacterium]
MKIALLVIDMQKAFYVGETELSMQKASDYINFALDLFRENNKKVIWIQDEDKEDGNEQGTAGFEVIDLLKPLPEEKRIIKHYGNSFNKTDLLKYLQQEQIDTLIITGYCAEYCVLSTYRGSLDYDLMPIILRGSLASDKPENIHFVENISEVITAGVLQKIIKEL